MFLHGWKCENIPRTKLQKTHSFSEHLGAKPTCLGFPIQDNFRKSRKAYTGTYFNASIIRNKGIFFYILRKER